MQRSLRSRRIRGARRRGATLVLFALLIVLLLAMVAFAIDMGYICLVRTQLQSAADSAAMAGVLGLKDGPAQARSNASHYAGLHIAAHDAVGLIANEDIQLGTWDDDTRTFTALSTAQESSANAVRVYCRRNASRKNASKLFFARVLGKSSADIDVFATARARTVVCGLITGVDKVTMSGSTETDSYNSESGAYSKAGAGAQGHVCSDGPITMSGSAKIHGDAHPGKGYTVTHSGSSGVTGDIEARTEPLSLPAIQVGNAATVNDNLSVPLSSKGKKPLNSKLQFSLSGSATVDLPPGTYYWSSLSLSGSSSVSISGKTVIYVTGNVSLSGSSFTNKTMRPKDLQLYVMGSTCSISGSTDFYGVVYAPGAKVDRSGSSDYYGMVVGKELTLSGSGGIHADESLGILDGADVHASLVE